MSLPKDIERLMDQYQRVFTQMGTILFERNNEIAGFERAILSASHVLLIGPAGAGKTDMADIFTSCTDAIQFNTQFTPFDTPEKHFGPLNILELKKGILKQMVGSGPDDEPYAPVAELIVADEVFDGHVNMLRYWHQLLNERRYQYGSVKVRCPLVTCIGTSNYRPEKKENRLIAFRDRYLQEYDVKYIEIEDNFKAMIRQRADDGTRKATIKANVTARIQMNDVKTLIKATKAVKWNDEIEDAMWEIRKELAEKKIVASDRRWGALVDLIKANAMVCRRDEVESQDLAPLIHCLGDPGQKDQVLTTLSRFAATVQWDVDAAVQQGEEHFRKFKEAEVAGRADDATTHAVKGSIMLRKILNELAVLKRKSPGEAPIVATGVKKIKTWRAEMSKKGLGLDSEDDDDAADDDDDDEEEAPRKPVKKR